MAKQIKITNGNLSALINYRGAELISFCDGDREIIWQGDEKFWASHAPILFPVCGGLKEDCYYLDGVKYFMPKHGYVRKVDFSLVECNENSVTFLLSDDQKSKEIFPFEFNLFVKYTLTDKLEIEYKVKNKSSNAMFFTIGAHEGYALENDFSSYSIVFDEDEDFKALKLYGNLIGDEYLNLGKGKELKLNYDYFAVDALVFKNINSRKVILKHNELGEIVNVVFDNSFKHLLLWTKPNAPYICIEPWVALPDRVDTNQNIIEKPDVVKIQPRETKSFVHVISSK